MCPVYTHMDPYVFAIMNARICPPSASPMEVYLQCLLFLFVALMDLYCRRICCVCAFHMCARWACTCIHVHSGVVDVLISCPTCMYEQPCETEALYWFM